ncbi:hypothetical protein C8R34_11047 [Nitrosomonas sp. Nm84]|nr:hypothetical protein C8R34_11047 [Nitrosomonas sp. Nm84]
MDSILTAHITTTMDGLMNRLADFYPFNLLWQNPNNLYFSIDQKSEETTLPLLESTDQCNTRSPGDSNLCYSY